MPHDDSPATTLRIEETRIEPDRLIFTYDIGRQRIERGVSFPEYIDLTKHLRRPAFRKMVDYCAIADSIYLFDIDYFDLVRIPFSPSKAETAFFESVFFDGLAEFRYTNGLKIGRRTRFDAHPNVNVRPSADSVTAEADTPNSGDAFVLNGGGKDGAIAMELAKKISIGVSWFSSVQAPSRARIVESSGIPDNFIVDRITPRSSSLARKYTGHKPMSFYIAMVAALSAYVTGRSYVIAANEYSANFPNVTVDGLDINHQYSKSLDFELKLRELFLAANVPVTYFSIIRPLFELQVAKMFTQFPQYHDSFVSCNRAIHGDRWCLSCPKCAFVIGAMYMLAPDKASRKWGDMRSFYQSRPELIDQMIELTNPRLKPFDCIGTTKENRLLLSWMVGRIDLSDEQSGRADRYLAVKADSHTLNLEDINDADNYPEHMRTRIRQAIKEMLS